MTQDQHGRPTYQPESTEDQVRHVLEAGERAAQNAGRQIDHAAADATSGSRSASDIASDAKDKAASFASDAKDKASDVVDTVKDKASDVVDTVKNKAAELKDQASNMSTSEMVDTVKDKASDLGDRAQEAGAQAAVKADEAMTATGGQLTTFAQTIREKAPVEGRVGEVAHQAADVLERSGSYLQQSDLNDVRGDLEQMIRRYPVQSLLVGLGVGYLLARATRR
ncbi:MAG: YtxH domain-containing protein [Chloroflexales bacterium]|nr:YtxH domain-containing protein [Chloroflexales bacterium]